MDFKLKYYGSILGLFWSFLKPFMMLGILYVVFFHFLKIGIENYPAYLLLGIILWNFFADTTKDSTQSITSKAHILQKINLSPMVVVISTITHSLWTFVINLGIFIVFFLVLGLDFSWSMSLLPLLLLMFVILVAGTSFLISPLYMRFKDFGHIWDIFLQMLFWASPIVYQYTFVPDIYLKWYLLNPIARIMVDAQNIVLYGFFPEPKQLIITAVIVIFIFVLGVFTFKKYSRSFIEQI